MIKLIKISLLGIFAALLVACAAPVGGGPYYTAYGPTYPATTYYGGYGYGPYCGQYLGVNTYSYDNCNYRYYVPPVSAY